MKLKNRIIYIGLIGMFSIVTSCEKFLDVNVDPNNPSEVSEPLLLTGVIANFSYEVLGGYPVRVTNTWVQQTAYNAVLPHYGIYDIDENAVNNTWTYYSYTDVMQNAKILTDQATANELYNYAAIAQIIWAWNMSIVTDLYGNAPFSEAWDPDNHPLPGYDTQEEIYASIQDLLDQAIANIDRTDGLNTYVVGSDDLVYGGDMDKWRKLAHVLKARFYMHLTYAPGHTAAAQSNLALTALTDGFTSNADNALYYYGSEPGQENPWYQYAIDGKWNTSTELSNTFVTDLTNRDDPRLYAMARFNGGVFTGHINGAPGAAANSAIGEYFSNDNAPLVWATYAEAKLLEAEALLLTGDKPGAETALQEGMTASYDQLQADITEKASSPENASGISTDWATYLSLQGTLNPNDQLAYQTIMTQKFIANFLQFEAYNDWRRTGYPNLTAAQNPIIPSMTEPARRFPYPSAELNYNSENVNAQGVPIGRNAVVERVWWNSAPEQCTLCN